MRIKRVRHTKYNRLRYGSGLKSFLQERASTLAATATGITFSSGVTMASDVFTFGDLPVATDSVTAGGQEYTFVDSINKAMATFTMTGLPVATDTVTIGTQEYTFVDAIVKASETFTMTALPVASDTVTIGGLTYTFVGTIGGAYTVLIGADVTACASNLAAAINAGSGGGTVYGTGTVAHTTVTASSGTGTVVATAKAGGVAGNGIAVSSVFATPANASWGSSATNGATPAYSVLIGVDVSACASNLAAAITAGAGGGTVYSTGTVAHTLVTAVSEAGTVPVTAAAAGVAGNGIAVSAVFTTPAEGTWDVEETEGATPAYSVLIGETVGECATNLTAAINAGSGSGTTYGVGTVANTLLTAVANSAMVVATARAFGTLGNGIACSADFATPANGTWASTATAGGVGNNLLTTTITGITIGEGPFYLTTTGTLPSGLAPSTPYWVSSINTETNKVTFAPSGLRVGEVTVASSGSGTHTMTRGVTDASFLEYIRNGRNTVTVVSAATDVDTL